MSDPGPEPILKKRRPWLAWLLGAVCPGLGHLYVGRPGAAVAVALGIQSVFCGLMIVGAWVPDLLFVLTVTSVTFYAAAWLTQGVWAALLARKARTYRMARYNRFAIYVGFFIASAVATNLFSRSIHRWVLEAYTNPSSSMAPSLLPGDWIFIVKSGREAEWKRGDIIVYPAPDSPTNPRDFERTVFIKRVIAVAGDTVEAHDKQVQVNGAVNPQQPCESPEYVDLDPSGHAVAATCVVERTREGKAYELLYRTDFNDKREAYGPTVLKPGQLFVIGDNRDVSMDSRYTGPISHNEVLGWAVVIWFSFTLTDGIRWNRMGMRL